MQHEELTSLIERFGRHDRNALAKIITLVESTSPSSKQDRNFLLEHLPAGKNATIRIAVSGTPGVGKSTFINVLGKKLVALGHKIAILPIDPSSELSLGSILADKTRMRDLMPEEKVFIRPSPSLGSLGGIAFATSDVILVAEAFGFDIVIVETVGVGQSETLAHSLCDHFVLLMQPGAGDQLQAMKKGILERADFILVNKADGEQSALAEGTVASLRALRGGHGCPGPKIMVMSALADRGVDDFLQSLLKRHDELVLSSELKKARENRFEQFFYHSFEHLIARRMRAESSIEEKCREKIDLLLSKDGAISPELDALAEEIMKTYRAGLAVAGE